MTLNGYFNCFKQKKGGGEGKMEGEEEGEAEGGEGEGEEQAKEEIWHIVLYALKFVKGGNYDSLVCGPICRL